MQIDLQHVEYCYQKGSPFEHMALQDINLRIRSGEMIAMIGHGGSGKSTLSLLLSGLYKPTGGRIDTYDVKTGRQESVRNIGLVFQYPEQQLFAETVYEEVAFGARNFGVPQDYLPIRVRKALELVGLEPDSFWNRSPFSLSGGQKRRVCIAGVLAVEPKMIILDEPTAGLDEGGRRWLLELVRQLNREGRSILWITHNMREAAELAQRIIVLNRGRILLDGSPDQVFAEEELLREAGLEIPMAAAVVRELKRRGIPLAGTAISVEEAAAEIGDYLARRDAPEPVEAEPEDVLQAKAAEEDGEPVISLESVLAAAGQTIPQPKEDAPPPPKEEPRFTPWQGGKTDV
ncbi:MAG: ATP-binding cassette domain-containing protein [Bacillota bacterium]|nr:ATP-binding cassette domain-containing protein [Bacillota bacterium]